MTVHDVPRNSFSLSKIAELRSEAIAAIRRHTAAVDAIAAALSDVDAALQLNIDCRSIDEQQVLVTHARRLASLLDCGEVQA